MRPDEIKHDEGDTDDPPVSSDPLHEEEAIPKTKPSHGLDILSLDELDDEDYDEDDDDTPEFDEDDDGVRTVLITGASGNIGRKLRSAWAEDYDLVLIDRELDASNPDVIAADLSEMNTDWFEHFQGVDTVIHLAANPDEFANWEELEGPNLDALTNVFNACVIAGVERLVFASSNHVMGGYRELDMKITEALPPKPDGPYGGSKLMGERLGQSIAKAFNITFVALRLGWNQAGENIPDTMPDDWNRSLWLSNEDLVRLFECAVEADLGDDLVVVANGMSHNSGMRWDITTAADKLGYSPEDDAYAEEL